MDNTGREERRKRREERQKRQKKRLMIAGIVFGLVVILAAVVAVMVLQKPASQEEVQSLLRVRPDMSAAVRLIRETPQRPELSTVTEENGEVVLADPDNIWVLVNKEYHLSSGYEPSDLVDVEVPFAPGRSWDVQRMRAEPSAALTRMFDAARTEAGYELYGASGYRSYGVQSSLFRSNVSRFGTTERANYLSAKAGQSEHQLGLAMDLTVPSMNYQLNYEFADTPEGQWVADNCWRFGFILRYTRDKTTITGYSYEPWHIRYVGELLAKYLYDKGLTLEEYYGFGEAYNESGIELTPDDQSYE